jgi:RNA 2',3'-cyclic 3'-phosphodiesterase
MRAFIAIELPQSLKENIKHIQGALEKHIPNCKWIKPQNIHLTLKFLGEVDDRRIDEIKTVLERSANNFSVFTCNLKNIGFFPDQKAAQILFISTDNEDYLGSISKNIQEGLSAIGFQKEAGFKSHITLARIKIPLNIAQLQERIKSVEPSGQFQIKEFSFFKSTLTKDGPIYQKIFTSSLTA